MKSQSLAYSGTGLSSTLTFNPTYTYDTANRLASAGESTGSGSWSEAFGYDRYGNVWLTSSSGIPAQPLMPNSAGAYNQTNNRLANGQYDASGNQQAFSTYVLT